MAVAGGIDVLASAMAAGASRRPSSPVAGRLRAEALTLAATEALGRGSFAYRIVPLDRVTGNLLWVEGEALEAPWLLPETGSLTALACGVCTLGPALEARVRELFGQGRRSLAMALDGIGNELLFALSRRMQHRMMAEVGHDGLCLAGELRSGDPGLALETQALVVRLAGGEALGVTVNSGAMMHPVKSASAVFGVGVDLPEAKWSRCDDCRSAARCAHARQPVHGD